MKWKNIKKAGLTTEQIAKRLRYSNANSFRNSSKYELMMDLLDEYIGIRISHPECYSKAELQLNELSDEIVTRNSKSKAS